MKALTIHQPYAHLIVTPADDLPDYAVPKRVENRTWETTYRGDMLIHAGKSLKSINHVDWPDSYGMPPRLTHGDFPEFVFGAFVGVAELVDIVRYHPDKRPDDYRPYKWIARHFHARGPFCWVLGSVRRFSEPVPYKGRQGLFEVPAEVVELEKRQVIA